MVTGQFPSSVSVIVSHDGAQLYLEEELRRGRTRRLSTTGRGPENQHQPAEGLPGWAVRGGGEEGGENIAR